MAEAWGRGERDGTERTPLSGRDAPPPDAPTERRDRHALLGVGHPSGDPARHRVFAIRAAFDPAAGGWVAHVEEQDRNDQAGSWSGAFAPRPFPTPAACLGDAVQQVVAAVDRDDRPPG